MTYVYPESDVDKDGWTDQVGGTANLFDVVNDAFAITTASWASSVATYTTSAAHGFTVGQSIRISGIKPLGYNQLATVVATPTSTTFTAALASNPGSYTSGGHADPGPVAADYVTTTFLGAASGEVPRMIVILMDDMRFDDLATKMTSGPRIGEYCLERTRNEILFTENTLFVPYFWDDYALCGPARIEILTGLYFRNHNLKNDEGTYYVNGRMGGKNDTPVWGTDAFMCGPWEFDLAHMFGLPHTPVTAAAQFSLVAAAPGGSSTYIPLVGNVRQMTTPMTSNSMGTFRHGLVAAPTDITGSADDLQAYTGMLPNWLREFGITCCFVGKYHNGYASPSTVTPYGFSFPAGSQTGTRFAPPGWNHWYTVTGDEDTFAGDIQDHYHTRMCLYDGPNDGDGMGAFGNERYYVYDWAMHAAPTWSSGKITFTLRVPPQDQDASTSTEAPAIGYADIDPTSNSSNNDPTFKYRNWVHDLQVGDEVDIDGVLGVAGYNGIGFIVTDVYDGVNGLTTGQFKVAHAGSLGSASIDAGSKCYIRKYFSDILFAHQAIAQLDQIADDEPFYMQWNPRAPHGDVEGGVVEHEFRYDFSVQNDDMGNQQFCHWNGGPGAVYDIATITSTASGGIRTATVALDSGPDVATWPGNDPLMVGDYIVIHDTATGYDGYYNIASVISSTQFTVQSSGSALSTYTGNPGHATSAHVQVRKYMSPALQDNVLSPPTIGSAIDFPISRGHRRTIWAERQEMLPSTDDGIGMILDYVAGRGWTNVMILFTSDNGYADGEQRAKESSDVWSGIGAKGWVWESSTRLPCYWYNTALGTGTTNILSSMADIPLTIMDLFSSYVPALALHHAFYKRDGYSQKRLIENALDPVHNRAIFLSGKFHSQANCAAIVTRDLEKYIAAPLDGTIDPELYDLTGTVYGTPEFLLSDWETNNLIGVNPTRDAQLDAYLTTALTQRWSIPLNRNTCRDAVT